MLLIKKNETTDTILDKHQQFVFTFNLTFSEEQAHLPKIYSNSQTSQKFIQVHIYCRLKCLLHQKFVSFTVKTLNKVKEFFG